jgi:hypothetical protein
MSRRDLDKLTTSVKDHQTKVQETFYAFSVREQIASLELEIMQDVHDLTRWLRAGERYDHEQWKQWENIHSHWREKLDEWLNLSTWYAMAVIQRVNTIDDAKYATPLTIPEENFPNAEAVRRFKKFLIIQTQWEDIISEVKSGLNLVAFSGLSPLDVRHGRPAG